MVLLRHTLVDASWHYDWLLDVAGTGGPEERNLVTFRVLERPDEAEGAFEARRLPDHRRLYLAYEGDIAHGEGGRVQRVAEWGARVEWGDDARLTVVFEGLKRSLALEGRAISDEMWSFTRRT